MEYLMEGDNVDIIYLDFRKVFDSVSHHLLVKVKQTWIFLLKIVNIVRYFNRSMNVKICNSYSETQTIPSDVPRASVLRPLLFLTFITFF